MEQVEEFLSRKSGGGNSSVCFLWVQNKVQAQYQSSWFRVTSRRRDMAAESPNVLETYGTQEN